MKKYAWLLGLCLSLAAGATAQEAMGNRESPYPADFRYNRDFDYRPDEIVPYRFQADELVRFARQYLGVPYVAEGKDSTGFDCSGFTFHVFRNFGVYLPYYSSQQAEIGLEIPVAQARRGDLICFKGYDATSTQVGHVGIVTSLPGQKLTWIHASSSKGVSTATLDSPYYKARLVTVRRVAE
jgi:cell wall-associated NlpC family hydrolase